MNDQIQKPINGKAEQKKKIGEIIETTKIMTKTQAELNEELLEELILEKRNYTKIKELINQGADINKIGEDGTTALMRAISTHEFNIAKVLIKAGADVNKLDKNEYSALTHMILKCEYISDYKITYKIIVDLLKAGAKVSENDISYIYLFKKTLNSQEFRNIEKILNKNWIYQKKLNKKLLIAFKKGNLNEENKNNGVLNNEFIECINNGGDINSKYKNGWTPLMYAVANNETYLVKQLINLGADIYIRDKNNLSPLDLAKMSNFEDMEKILIDEIKKKNPRYLERDIEDNLPF